MPLVYSILGDLVTSSSRTVAAGLVGISIGVGQGMGQVRRGALPWGAFFISRLPSVVHVAIVSPGSCVV